MTTMTVSPYGHRPRLRGSERRQAEAYHEASHAVVAAALGCADVWITVDPQTGEISEGRFTAPATYFTLPQKWSAERRTGYELSIVCAGHMGEILRFGSDRLHASGGDAAAADKLLAALPESRRAAVEDTAITRTREVLRRHLGRVEWLARELESHPILCYEPVGDLARVSFGCTELMPAERAEMQRN